MNEKESDWFWNKITLLSFICSIMVVYLHSDNTEQYYLDTATRTGEFVLFVETDVLQFFAQGAVPLFFFISGFLFFRNFNFNKLYEKYKSRFKGLLIPYLAWNMIYTFIVVLFSCIPVIRDNIGYRWVMSPITVIGILKGIFLYQYNSVFWFMFQLIIFVVISPILYGGLKNKHIGIIFIILISVVSLKIKNIPVFNSRMLMLYALGGYLSNVI